MFSPKFWSVANVIGLVAVITVNALANALPINGYNTGELSDFYPNLFVPAGVTFSIWGVIYLLLASFTIYGLSQAFRKPAGSVAHLEKIGPFFLLNCIANISWIMAWHHLYINLSLVIMLCLLATLIAMYQRLNIGSLGATRAELTRVHIAISVYLGWICIATIANATAVLVNAGWDGFGMGPVGWAVLMIVIGMLLSLRMLIGRRDIFFSLVVIWAFIGILIKRSQVGTLGAESIMITAGIAIGLIVMGIGFRFKAYRNLYKG